MKKYILTIALVSTFLSCSEDNGLNIVASMSATINNAEWNTLTRVTVLNDDKFIITGTSLDGKSLAITIMGTQTGTYELSTTAIQCGAIYKESVSSTTEDAYVAFSGQVELTEVNTASKEISGTFSFSLRKGLIENPIAVENGTFSNLKYTESQGN